MAAFLGSIVALILAFELLRLGSAYDVAAAYFVGTAPFGFLLLFVGAALFFTSLGYLLSPLEAWRAPPHAWEEPSVIPSDLGVDRGLIARRARLAGS